MRVRLKGVAYALLCFGFSGSRFSGGCPWFWDGRLCSCRYREGLLLHFPGSLHREPGGSSDPQIADALTGEITVMAPGSMFLAIVTAVVGASVIAIAAVTVLLMMVHL